MRKMALWLGLLGMLAAAAALASNDAVELPSWSSRGDIKAELSSTGERISGILSSVVAILSVIGMLVGAAMFPVGRGEDGKRWILGSAVGLIVAGSVYGIAGLFL